MAYKVFSNGDALTGSELNTYLMNQSVISFATATARDAALTTPTEGTPIVWLEDSNKHVYYTGSAWADLITPASSGNAIINGAFDIWQRGTSFNTGNSDYYYTADRWQTYFYGSNTATVSQQTFTPGTAPVSGYEGTYFLRFSSTTTNTVLRQQIEDVRTFANQTVTVSFWAKAASAISLNVAFTQWFGTGGSSPVDLTGQNVSLTTSWQRLTATFTIPSIAGKTVGSSSSLRLILNAVGVTNTNIDLWGVQVEAGSTATAFKRNASNIQGELAACQRYYHRATPAGAYGYHGNGAAFSSTQANILINLPVTMRTSPASIEYSNVAISDSTNPAISFTGLVIAQGANSNVIPLTATVSSGLTQYRPYSIVNNNNTTGYIGFSAEL